MKYGIDLRRIPGGWEAKLLKPSADPLADPRFFPPKTLAVGVGVTQEDAIEDAKFRL